MEGGLCVLNNTTIESTMAVSGMLVVGMKFVADALDTFSKYATSPALNYVSSATVGL